MTTDVEAATKTLNDLLDQKDALVARANRLAADRASVAYAAHAGKDKAAMERLRKVNDTAVTYNVERESLKSLRNVDLIGIEDIHAEMPVAL